jgi:hypothetical protein
MEFPNAQELDEVVESSDAMPGLSVTSGFVRAGAGFVGTVDSFQGSAMRRGFFGR